MNQEAFDQSSYSIRFEWGPKGARDAAERGGIVVIVDVLSFSSAVVAALENGAIVYPHAPNAEAKSFAEGIGAILTVRRGEERAGAPSLSPMSWNKSHQGKKYVLSSPNGAVCVSCADKAREVLVGGLVNASAVAKTIKELQKPVTVIAAGERWQDARPDESMLRPCIEDYLGAGAILTSLDSDLSPEAIVCRNAFEASREQLEDLIWNSGSGRELRAIGYEEDVRFSSQLNSHDIVPQMKDGQMINISEV